MRTTRRLILPILIALPFGLLSCTPPSREESAKGPAVDDYPLTTCVVSGKELGSVGKPVKLLQHGVTVMLCSKGCIPEFQKSPSEYLAKLKK
jgi:hypothetical protein